MATGNQIRKIKLLLTDGAAYMVKCGKHLEILFQLNHVTCLAHALSLVAEVIRNQYEDAIGFISNVTKVFLKKLI